MASVAVAIIRGIVRRGQRTLGNFSLRRLNGRTPDRHAHTTLTVTSMLPRVAFEYGQTWWA